MKFLSSTLQIEGDSENNRKEIITDISQGHEIREPGIDPLFHPDSGVDAEKEEIDLDQIGIDIGPEILDHIAEGLVDGNDEDDRREVA
jgi:hypothetical protein